ncbi:phage tail tape measure protein [Anaerocolumna jejuensis]|uniref:phage tail tape measure protein n=1 Tax=Anaerocolumna jejuensis TaxID=259063 RepID=UPI003F7C87AA
MADNFKVALQASIDIQKSQNEINKQIKTLKTDAIKIGIELDTKSAQKAISELSKEAKSLMDQDKLISNNKINSSLSNNPIINGELTSKLKEVKGELKSTDKIELTNLNKQFKNITSETESLGKKGDTVFSKLGKKISDLLIDLAINTLRNMVNEVANLDKSLVDLQMATGYTHSQAKELLSTYIDLGQQMGATGTEVADIASDYLRQGKTVAEANALVKDSLILSKIGNMESADATTYLTTIMKGYKVSVSDVIDIIDKLSAVDIASAASTEGLAQAMSKNAENAEMSGISMDKLLGIIAVIGDTTGEEMSSVGDSVNSMLSRMNNIKLSNLIDPETGEDLSNVETSLNNVGISLKDTGDTYRDFGDVLDETAGKWDTYSSATQQNIAASIAGKEHMGDFLVLMSEYSKANEYATASTNSSGSAMELFANYENSLEAKTKSLADSFQKLASDSLDSEVIKGFMDLANALIQVIDKVGIFNIALLTTTGILGGKGILMIPQLATFIGGLIQPMLGVSAAAGTLAGAMGAALSVMLPIAAIIVAVAAYNKLNVTLEETQAKLSKQKEAYDSETEKVQSLTTELETTKKKLEELNRVGGTVVTKDGEKEKLQAQTNELQRQLDIAKETQRIKGLEAEQTATETLGDKINSKYNAQEIHSDFFGYSVKYDKVTRDVELGRTIEDYNNLSKSYTDLEKKQQTLAKSEKGNTKEFKNNSKELTDISGKMVDARKYANELATKMQTESESLIGATTDGNAMKATIDSSLESYNSWINSINKTNSSLGETGKVSEKANNGIEANANSAQEATDKLQQTNDVIDDYQKKMDEIKDALSNADKLSTSDIMDMMQQFPTFDWEKYGVTGAAGVGDLIGALKALGGEQYDTIAQCLGARDSFKALYNETVNVTNAAGLYENTLSSAIDSISMFNTSLSSMNSAYSSLSQNQSVSSEDIVSLSEAFGNVDGFDDFIKIIYSAKSMTSDVQDAFNSLVGTYIGTSGVLNALTEDNKQLIATQLQHIGISNAEQVVTEALARKKKILAETGEDVTNATADEILQLLNEHNISEDTRVALANLAVQKLNANNVALSTSDDIQNLISLMETANSATGALRVLQTAKSFGASGSGLKYLNEAAQKEVDNYLKSLQKKTKAQFSNVKYSGGEKTKSVTENQKKTKDKTVSQYSQELDLPAEKIKILQNEIDGLNSKLKNTSSIEAQVKVYEKLIQKQSELATAYKKTAGVYQKQYSSALTKLSKSDQEKVRIGAYTIEQFSGTGSDSKDEKRYNAIKYAIDVRDKLADTNSNVQNSTLQLKTYAAELADIPWDTATTKVDKINNAIDLLNEKLKNTTNYEAKNKILDKILSNEKKVVDTYASAVKESEANITSIYSKISKNNRVNSDGKTVKSGIKISTTGITDPKQLAYIIQYNKQINELNENTATLSLEQEKYKGHVADTKSQKFQNLVAISDELLKKYSDLDDEIQFSSSLLEDNSNAQILVFQTGFNNAKNSMTAIKSEIEKLNKLYKSGSVAITDYKDRLSELKSRLNDSATSMKSYQDDILSAIKDRYDKEMDASKDALDEELKNIEKKRKAEEDTINKEIDNYKEYIDARKKALQNQSDVDKYQEELDEYSKSITKLESRIALLKRAELSGDRSASAERAELEEELSKQKKELSDKQNEHNLDTSLDALDNEYDAYEKMKNNQIDDINEMYDSETEKAQKLYDFKSAQIKELYEDEKQLIVEAAKLTSDDFSKAFSEINSTLSSFGLSASTGLKNSLKTTNKENTKTAENATSSNSSEIKAFLKSGTGTTSNSELNKYIKEKYGSTLTFGEMVKLAAMLRVNGISQIKDVSESSSNRMKILSALKAAKFATGGTVDASRNNTVSTLFGEDGIAFVKHKEEILTPEKANLLRGLLDVATPLKNLGQIATNNLSSVITNNNSSPNIIFNLNGGTISKEVIPQFDRWKDDITKMVTTTLENQMRKK